MTFHHSRSEDLCLHRIIHSSDRHKETWKSKKTFKPSPQCGFSHQTYTDKNHVDHMTDDDRALLVLYSSKQEPLKVFTTSNLGLLECQSWFDDVRLCRGPELGHRSLGPHPKTRQRRQLPEDQGSLGPPRIPRQAEGRTNPSSKQRLEHLSHGSEDCLPPTKGLRSASAHACVWAQ